MVISSYKDLVKQNLKNLLMTIPGERMMDPNFGVGLRKYLFEQDSLGLQDTIVGDIQQQVSKYLSYIELESIDIHSADRDPHMDINTLDIDITYRIIPLSLSDTLEITTTIN